MKMEIVNEDNLRREVESIVKPEEKQKQEIRELAEQNTNEIMALDLENLVEKRNMLKSIEVFAIETMQNSARKNSLLQTN